MPTRHLNEHEWEQRGAESNCNYVCRRCGSVRHVTALSLAGICGGSEDFWRCSLCGREFGEQAHCEAHVGAHRQPGARPHPPRRRSRSTPAAARTAKTPVYAEQIDRGNGPGED